MPPFYLINAFAPSFHGGNQAAVVILPESSDLDDERLQLIASETAYISQKDEEDGTPVYSLRWFTPEQEVVLCGHATLASAYVLLKHFHQSSQTIYFETIYSGRLVAKRIETGIEITLPSLSASVLSEMKDSKSSEIYQKVVKPFTEACNDSEEDQVVNVESFEYGEYQSLIIELSEDVDLEKLNFDYKAISQIANGMIIVTQQARTQTSNELSINSRVLCPGLGIDEDPVTGSAHAYLTGYYLQSPACKRLPKDLIASGNYSGIVINARQLSKRGGELRCKWDDGKVRIQGKNYEYGNGEPFLQ